MARSSARIAGRYINKEGGQYAEISETKERARRFLPRKVSVSAYPAPNEASIEEIDTELKLLHGLAADGLAEDLEI